MRTIRKKIEDLKEKNFYRELRVLENHQGLHANFNGQKTTLFCSNDYLGLTHHTRILEAAKRAIDKNGVGAGGARLISGTFSAHKKLEDKIAQIKEQETALVFGSGFLANIGTLTAIAGKDDILILDKLCHASLVDGARQSGAELRVFPHKNYEKCEEILKKDTAGKKIVVTESIFSMDGDLADLKEIVRIKNKYGATLVVDDAHGTGVVGAAGGGATKDVKGIDVVIGTLSKSVGAFGGFVASSNQIIEEIINFSRAFIFATALPPAICEAAHEAFCVMENEPQLQKKLWENINEVYQELTRMGFLIAAPKSAILPVVLGDEKKAVDMFEALLRNGVFIPAVRYPTVAKGKARLRITLSATHKKEDIQKLLQAFKSVQ